MSDYTRYLMDSPNGAEEVSRRTGGRVGCWLVSKWQKNHNEMTGYIKTMVFADEYSCDAAIAVPEKGVYAVFDGVSQDGYEAARKAARFAAEQVAMRSLRCDINDAGDLADLVEKVDGLMVDCKIWPDSSPDSCRNMGHTTASVVKILRERPGRFELVYAHVGDSRIYHVTGNEVRQITTDETNEYGALNNIMGYYPPREKRTVRQFDEFTVRTGDHVVIVTDGITKGGWLGFPLEDEDLAGIVRGSGDVLDAAKSLIANSESSDDSTAIVLKF